MKLREYVRDRIGTVILFFVSFFMMLIFFRAFQAAKQLEYIIFLIYFIAFLSCFFWDYFKKRFFYNRILSNLKELDKKYLLSDMMERPQFYEGQILYDILLESNKSMAEQVASYRRQSNEFREYIETWVHEIKIPLAAMRLMCHNNPVLGEKMVSQLKLMDDDVNNVLFYARSENAHKDYMIKEVSLKKAFGSVAVSNRSTLLLLDAQLKTEGLDQTVLSDQKWLEFILGQLMSNSIKYRNPERQLIVLVYAEEKDNVISLHFRDNGLGIASSDISRVFEKTFTGENGQIGAKSTGMGLYIVKSLCDKLGHGIRIISEKGEYTEVMISFSNNDFYKM